MNDNSAVELANKTTSAMTPQSEIALRLQQEMIKKNLDQSLYKNQASHSFVYNNNNISLTALELLQNQQLLYGQQYQYSMGPVNASTANLFSLTPLQQQQLIGSSGQASAYQTKMSSYQSDKRNSVHYKPY